MLLNQCTEEVAGTGNASAEAIRNVRPSGIRMPSPKIGFFDEVHLNFHLYHDYYGVKSVF